ncbi:phosphatase PAP2 family protein [Streptomyces sp. NPDC046821]|uniref:phosphatase PAP2 family protein n=1 Tax=Streptomyces sp. NPDC046821 TaxID=3154702 RepID=UPI0033F24304
MSTGAEREPDAAGSEPDAPAIEPDAPESEPDPPATEPDAPGSELATPTSTPGSPAHTRRESRIPLLTAATSAVCALLFTALTTLIVVRHGQPLPGDAALHDWARAHRPPVALALGRAVTATGTGVWPYLLAVLAGAFAWRGAPARGRLKGAVLALAVLVAGQLIRTGLMELIARARPARHDWATQASGHSFPSGHATTSAIVAGLLCWAARRTVTRVIAVSWALAVGLTRIELGVHWPTDVLAGWLLATAWLLALHTATPRFRAPRLPTTDDPTPAPRRIRRVTPLPPRATRRQTGPTSGEPELPVLRAWVVTARPH